MDSNGIGHFQFGYHVTTIEWTDSLGEYSL